MKVSLNWLNDYVDIKGSGVTLNELCDKMVMLGFEVDGLEDLSESMSGVLTGKIEKIEKHPDADKLVICAVNVGEEMLQIVTGATNVFEGAVVPVATHGSKLPNGMNIKKGKLRGVESFGMLCSGEELQIKDSDYEGAEVNGILILKEDTPVGADMRDILGFDDVIIDFAITANRPDCLSVIGIAREVAVALQLPITMPLESGAVAESAHQIEGLMTVRVEDYDLCPRYMGSVVRGIKLESSPEWMQKRLKAAGMRPINNIVDITNFVMLETGQPMHAFDLRDVAGGQIIVRRAKENEIIVTLDDAEHTLTNEMLVIADEMRPSALAGIMGGLNSEIKDDTTEVFFESAQFRRDSVRKTARALGMRTESSARFEKGTDIMNVGYAMERALQLISLLGAGEVVEGLIDCNNGLYETRIIQSEVNQINALLGVDVLAEDMVNILNKLDIETQLADGVLTSKIPSYRGDIDGKADIAEEVMRVYGYHHIVGRPIDGVITRGQTSAEHAAIDKIRKRLTAEGISEISTYSFVNKNAVDKLGLLADDSRRQMAELLNPLTEDYAAMRTQMITSMLTVLATNNSRKIAAVRYFEVGKIFIPKQLPVTEQPLEKNALSIGLYGEEEDFFTLKGAVEAVLSDFGVSADYVRSDEPYLHDGREAYAVVRDTKGELRNIAVVGEITPAVQDDYGFASRVYVAEIDLDLLFSFTQKTIIYKPLPKFPAMARDLALVCDYEMPVADIERTIRKSGGKYLESIELFDVYTGAQILAGKKSVAYALRFRSMESTLTDEVVDGVLDKVFAALEKEGCTLRR